MSSTSTDNKILTFLIAETPLHVGGSEQIGLVDLPIQRERHTMYPKIEASSLKGTIKAAMKMKIENENNEIDCDNSLSTLKNTLKELILKELMGAETTDNNDKASAIAISDARILLFPVKTPNTVFAWVTSPYVIMRFIRDNQNLFFVNSSEISISDLKNTLKEVINERIALVPDKNDLLINNNSKKIVLLEDYYLPAKSENIVGKLASKLSEITYGKLKNTYEYWKEKMKHNLVIVPDDVFKDLVVNSTEIITRIKMDYSTKTVSKTGLFNEEFLPEDTIMYFTISSQKPPNSIFKCNAKVLDCFMNFNITRIQIGADATLGKGYTRIIYLRQENEEKRNERSV